MMYMCICRLYTAMEESDIVIGWITDNNEYVLENRYREAGSGNGQPLLFEDQSFVRAIDGFKETVNGTTMSYMRYEKAVSGVLNNKYAVPISTGTMNVLWAVGDTTLAVNDTPSYHGNCASCRGFDKMNFNVILDSSQNKIEWYTYLIAALVLIIVFFCGMFCSYFFFKNRCLDKAKYAQFGVKEASVQKKVLLEE